jgi:hypothetical protein
MHHTVCKVFKYGLETELGVVLAVFDILKYKCKVPVAEPAVTEKAALLVGMLNFS